MYVLSKFIIEMVIMFCLVVFGSLVVFVNFFLIRGVFVKVDLVMSISVICIEKVRSF